VIERCAKLASIERVRHGFSTRCGGVSTGAYESLNVARNLDDDPDAVRENRTRLMAAIGLEGAPLVEVDQVHGARVITVDAPLAAPEEADALVSRTPGLAVGVRTADCAPVLFAGEGVVAAAHAGWRSAVARIVGGTIEAMGVAPATLQVAIGPAIGIDAFEVGDEVIDAANDSLASGAAPAMKRGKWHLDLRGLVRAQLVELGVPADRIALVGGCTFATPDRYFSHRRDRGRTGRHLSVIGLLG